MRSITRGTLACFITVATGAAAACAGDGRPHGPQADATCIAGRLTDEGVECPALRGRDGTLYTLVGNLGDLEPDDEACVCGTEPAVSFCMQGTTLAVESIARTCPD